MPKLIEERWIGIFVGTEQENLPMAGPDGQIVHGMDGQPKLVEHTTIVFTHLSPLTGMPEHIVRIPLTPEAKQDLLRMLTGGVIVPAVNGGPPAI